MFMIKETLDAYANLIKDTVKKVSVEKYVEVIGLIVIAVIAISYWRHLFLW